MIDCDVCGCMVLDGEICVTYNERTVCPECNEKYLKAVLVVMSNCPVATSSTEFAEAVENEFMLLLLAELWDMEDSQQ